MSKEGLQKRSAGGDLGGTMRLGAYDAVLAGQQPCLADLWRCAGDLRAPSPPLRGQLGLSSEPLERQGLIFSGMSPDGLLPEIVERPDHPWFVGVQFHPELKSKPFDPHPLFAGFIAAALDQSRLV